MLSRALFRNALRTPPRVSHLPLPKSFPSRPCVKPAPPTFQRFKSQYRGDGNRSSKIPSGRYNPYYRDARNAKPLVTVEQIVNTFTHSNAKWIYILVTSGGIIFYVSHLEDVPVSGRRRFNCYSDKSVEANGDVMYRAIMQDARDSILPDWDPRTIMVRRVMRKLIPASGLEHVDWEVHVIQSDDTNAFVIPGGKVFVFTGILPIARDDDGLAAILGHEIAHNLARHQAESMSSMILLAPIRWTLIFLDSTGWTFGLGRFAGDIALELGLARPASRRQESEADYIGLMLMSKACYDPSAAVGVWQRMEAAQKDQIPQWLSTHPSNTNRIHMMEEWMPKAEAARNDSDCAVTLGFAEEFQNAMGSWSGWGSMN